MQDPIDPSRATSPAFNRRAFVGLSAGAAAYAGATVRALAQDDAFGKPHPPIVPEHAPGLAAAWTSFTNAGRKVDAYYAAPKNAGPTTPGVVLVQAIWGVDAQLRDVARRFAQEGYIALAPDLYAGLGAPNGDNATDAAPFRAAQAALNDATVDSDIRAAANFLAQGAGGEHMKVGLVGFCMGGAIALRQTVDNAASFAAAAVFYGRVRYGTESTSAPLVPIAIAYASEIGPPLLGSYGARDTSIPASDVKAFENHLDELRKPHDIKIYDEAGHAFFDDTRSSYVASASADAWQRVLAWFRQYLR
jgi:carboxymethylenebutenolidase